MILIDGCENDKSHFSKWQLPKKSNVHISDYGWFLCALHALIGF